MLKSSYYFFRDIVEKRSMIIELVKRDLQQQYIGSYLGFVWLFLQPLLFIVVLYTVFTLGFRVGRSSDMPFSLYLIIGMVAWIHFSTNLGANTDAIRSYAFLVKKVDFRLSILPVVKMTSSLVAHAFLLSVAIGFSWYQGYPPSIYSLQLIYYLAAMSALLLGLAWLTSATSIFIKDVSNIVQICIQSGFWLTPILWQITRVPEQYRWIVELNPVVYIVTGYRDSIVTHVPFWEREATLYYWLFTLVTLYLGISVYRKLRPHFAEVL